MDDGHQCDQNPTPKNEAAVALMIDIHAFINFGIFFIFIIVNTIVLSKIKFKIERWAAITILSYLVSTSCRLG